MLLRIPQIFLQYLPYFSSDWLPLLVACLWLCQSLRFFYSSLRAVLFQVNTPTSSASQSAASPLGTHPSCPLAQKPFSCDSQRCRGIYWGNYSSQPTVLAPQLVVYFQNQPQEKHRHNHQRAIKHKVKKKTN